MVTNLIWGYWGENILDGIRNDLCERSCTTIYIDPTKDAIPDIRDFPVNFFTSNHFTRTTGDLNDGYPEFEIKHDFYDVLGNVKCAHLFFFIHDHSELLVLDEPYALKNFTAVITPWPVIHSNVNKVNLYCCDIAFKNREEFYQCEIKRRAVWFVSNIKFNVQRLGLKGFADEICKLIRGCDVAVKLPEYGSISSSIEQQLSLNGVDVIPSTIPSAKIIVESEIIISSSFSGVAAQAYYYRKDCVIVKNMHPNDFRAPHSSIHSYATKLGSPTIIGSNAEMKYALGVSRARRGNAHRCDIFRDQFIDNFSDYLFS